MQDVRIGWGLSTPTVTIANTETDSTMLTVKGWRSGRIYVPAAITAAYLSVLAVRDVGDTPGACLDSDATQFRIPTTGNLEAGKNYPIDPKCFEGVGQLQFVSSVAQGGDRVFKIGLT